MSNANHPGKDDDIFVTYAWGNKQHELQVQSFVALLRRKGYGAWLDHSRNDERTATNFNSMMHYGLQDSSKVIVVLSPEYKDKAENKKRSIQYEYQLIMNEWMSRDRKYIFVAFQGVSDEIVPFGYKGADVVNVTNEDGLRRLYSKLNDEPLIKLPPVSTERVRVTPSEPQDFETLFHINSSTQPLITLNDPAIKQNLPDYYRFQTKLSFTGTSYDAEALTQELEKTVSRAFIRFFPALNPAFRRRANHREFLYIGNLSQGNIAGYEDIHAIAVKENEVTFEILNMASSSIVKNLHYEIANLFALMATVIRLSDDEERSGKIEITLETNSEVTFTPQNSPLSSLISMVPYVFTERETISQHVDEFSVSLFQSILGRIAKLFSLKSQNAMLPLSPLLKVEKETLIKFIGSATSVLNF